ncbi:hypothetical protein GCM10011273_27490 [Asticcacaulis endophyticus]|uniref:Uncharacterized protein n=1 Tax=Asticcacaulis endophyticus TaxID=1395890 RepID=A0A918QDE8_9CAUL|nr:hypothetical protein GCM10011273_27490 [Asticcacaulis endophyticus]
MILFLLIDVTSDILSAGGILPELKDAKAAPKAAKEENLRKPMKYKRYSFVNYTF